MMKSKVLLLLLLFSILSPRHIITNAQNEEEDKDIVDPCEGRMAFVTGATGSLGGMATHRLLDENFCVRILTRNATKTQEKFGDTYRKIDVVVGQLGDGTSVEQAFARHGPAISHVVFTAGGEEADFDMVNNLGVAECAQALHSSSSATKKSMVVISAAWVSKPYSLASILFNSLYDKLPMAVYLQGEDVLRKVAADYDSFSYVILRAGRLVPDNDYPVDSSKGLLFAQGDTFFFWGPAGAPGMCHGQLTNAVITAMQVEGKITVEVTGGTTDPHDVAVYTGLRQDDPLEIVPYEDVTKCHLDALWMLKACLVLYVIVLLLGCWFLAKKSMLGTSFFILASFPTFCVIWTFTLGHISVLNCVNQANVSNEL